MEARLDAAIKKFVERNPKSRELHEQALQSLPGGNTRTLLYTAPFPISIQRGEGHKLYDEDGHEYHDFVGELTAGLFGHTNPRIQEALLSTIQNIGLSLGATSVYEQRYASLICQRFDIEQMRFTNSGTEANINCIAAARRYTGRRKVVAFRGGYHGSVLAFATGIAPNNVDQDDWIVVQYNDVKALESAFQQHSDIAAVIVEGMQGSAGYIRGSPAFLNRIQELCEKTGAVFILDEVMTSRLAPGGLKSLLGIQPDMVTFGKYLGGGMPFGAFGGKKAIMDVYDPRSAGSLAHSGTFQNNTLMLNAGYVGLSEVYTSEVVELFNKDGDNLRQRLSEIFRDTRLCVTGRGSLMCIHASRTGIKAEEITCKDSILAVEDPDLKKLFWLEMLEAGFWVLQRGSIALNLQIPQQARDLFVEAVSRFCDKHRALVSFPN